MLPCGMRLLAEQIMSVLSGDFSEWLNAGLEGDYNNGELDAADLDLQAVAIDDGVGSAGVRPDRRRLCQWRRSHLLAARPEESPGSAMPI